MGIEVGIINQDSGGFVTDRLDVKCWKCGVEFTTMLQSEVGSSAYMLYIYVVPGATSILFVCSPVLQ